MLQKMPYSEQNKQAIEALHRAEQLRILSHIKNQFAVQLEKLEELNAQRQVADTAREFRITK